MTEPPVCMQGSGPPAYDTAMSQLTDPMMKHIEATFAEGPYLLGERFTAVDILYMSLFEHASGVHARQAQHERHGIRW
jgi:glutathione S-transferase